MRCTSRFAGLLVVATVLAGFTALLGSTSAGAAAPRSLDPDAGMAGDSAPDPLAPQETDQPAPRAPGTPAAPTEQRAEKGEIDPVVVLVRTRLASPPAKASSGDRTDFAALTAFYAGDTDEPVWSEASGPTQRARLVAGEIAKADDWGLKAQAFDLPAPIDAAATPEARADYEIRLGLAVLKYARHARGGRLDPSAISRRFDQKPVVYEPRSILQAVSATEGADEYLRALHPQHPQFHALRKALLEAREDKQDGATPAGSASRQRSEVQRIIVNMERWRWLPLDLTPFHVWDSVPEQVTRVIDNGKVVLSEKIVVGKPSSPTPVFSADMLFVIFHPSWGVPPGMKVHELWPQLKTTGGGGWFSSAPLASSVLNGHGLKVTRGGASVNPDSIDWKTVDIRNFEFNQPPGPKNVLGMVKFRFPNRHDVYMHDTPERHLFGGAVRAFSHGCMRVQNPVHLAEVLLAHDKGWSAEQVQQYARRGGEIKLTTPIPVHITYFTTTVDEAGKLHSHPDIYGFDNRVASALEGRETQIAGAVAVSSEAAKSAAGTERVAKRVKAASRQKPVAGETFNPASVLFNNN